MNANDSGDGEVPQSLLSGKEIGFHWLQVIECAVLSKHQKSGFADDILAYFFNVLMKSYFGKTEVGSTALLPRQI